MRLKTTYKNKPKKTEKTKELEKERKSKGPKLNEDYMSHKKPTEHFVTVDLTRLSYGYINSCDLLSVTVEDGTVELENSWIEYILIMLDALIRNKPDEFQKLFVKYEICDKNFTVDKFYGKVSTKNTELSTYNIYNSGYYLEANFTTEVIYNAISKLSKCLGYSVIEMQFNLENREFVDADLNFGEVSEEETICGLKDVNKLIKKGIHMVSMDICGETVKAHRIDVALYMLCCWAYCKFDMFTLGSVEAIGNTGISLSNEDEDDIVSYQSILGSQLYIHTDFDADDIVKYMSNLISTLGLNKDSIKFKFRALKAKDKLKEWEVE